MKYSNIVLYTALAASICVDSPKAAQAAGGLPGDISLAFTVQAAQTPRNIAGTKRRRGSVASCTAEAGGSSRQPIYLCSSGSDDAELSALPSTVRSTASAEGRNSGSGVLSPAFGRLSSGYLSVPGEKDDVPFQLGPVDLLATPLPIADVKRMLEQLVAEQMAARHLGQPAPSGAGRVLVGPARAGLFNKLVLAPPVFAAGLKPGK